MSHFIFPVIIESRKILFLDLEPLGSNPDIKNVGEDVFIAKLPDSHEKTILSIPKNKVIQSLHKQIEDIELKDVGFSFQYDNQLPCIKITVGKNVPKEAYHDQELFEGLFMHIDEGDAAIELKISKSNRFESMKHDHVYIQILLNPDSGNAAYAACLQVFLADKENILYAGFDFGSEASQICEGDHKGGGGDLRQKDVNLFADVKSGLGGTSNNEEYMQYETPKLYKSIFHVQRSFIDDSYHPSNRDASWLLPPGSIKALTLNNEITTTFFDKWVQLPNLKLIYDNPSIGNDIAFNITSQGNTYGVDLINVRSNLYASLLKGILISYLSKRIHANVYLRFTLLVPNIYSINEIVETKKIIRSIVLNSQNPFHQYVKGLEISSLSESDAAFLGCVNNFQVKGGSYYIIIDCGKGTTDYSIIQFEGRDTFKSIYRNGFAGAGNLITFGLLQSVMYYLKQNQKGNIAGVNFEAFKNTHLSKVPNYSKNALSLLAEKWKKGYNNSLTQEEVEIEWGKAKSVDLNLENLFSRQREFAEVESFLSQIKHVYDWGGFISAAVGNIIGKIHEDLSQIVKHLKSPCGGILLTGRGYMFKPLQDATETIIRSIKGLEDVHFIDTRGKNLKEICLEGVFVRSILSYNDIASTPIEIKKGTLRQITKSDLKVPGFITTLKRLLNMLADEGEYYDEDSNSCKVLNTDFAECQFLVGNKRYHPQRSTITDITEAWLVQSRKQLYIKARLSSGKMVILPMENIVQKDPVNQLMVEKSLFPGWYDPHLLES